MDEGEPGRQMTATQAGRSGTDADRHAWFAVSYHQLEEEPL
ncbi:MAG: hypothetical protein U1F36_08585 [Planctomycetota bacterium]